MTLPTDHMSQQEWEQRVQRFFIPTPGQPVKAYVWLAVGAAVLILSGMGHIAILGFIGLVALVVGAIKYLHYLSIWSSGRPKATGPEIDAMLDGKLAWLVDVGVNRMGVHPTELGSRGMQGQDWRLVFTGLPQDLEPAVARPGAWHPDRYLYVGLGKDNRLRFSRYQVVIIYLSNYRMPVYECTLDIATGATVTDTTREYNLASVEGFETTSNRINVQVKEAGTQGSRTSADANSALHFTTRQQISLVVSGREAISLMTGINGSEAINILGANSVDGMIASLREHLREHHRGTQLPVTGLPGGLPGPAPVHQLGPAAGPPPDHSLELPPRS
jgi:hypothetical protein